MNGHGTVFLAAWQRNETQRPAMPPSSVEATRYKSGGREERYIQWPLLLLCRGCHNTHWRITILA